MKTKIKKFNYADVTLEKDFEEFINGPGIYPLNMITGNACLIVLYTTERPAQGGLVAPANGLVRG
jgi:hypothetical protein